jgi:hypothetical protein
MSSSRTAGRRAWSSLVFTRRVDRRGAATCRSPRRGPAHGRDAFRSAERAGWGGLGRAGDVAVGAGRGVAGAAHLGIGQTT